MPRWRRLGGPRLDQMYFAQRGLCASDFTRAQPPEHNGMTVAAVSIGGLWI